MATSQELATYFLAFMNRGAPHQELISSISAGGSISNFEREVMASSDPRKLDFCTIAEATEIVAADPTKNVVAEVRGNGNLKTLDTDNPQIDLYGQWVRVAIASGQAPVAPAVIPHPAPLPVQPTGGGGGPAGRRTSSGGIISPTPTPEEVIPTGEVPIVTPTPEGITQPTGLAGITGAVVGLLGTGGAIVALILAIGGIGAGSYFLVRKKKK